MPTIPELKTLAKENNVYISSRANKSDIEEALRKANVPFEASVARAPAKPKASGSSVPATAIKPGALIELTFINEDRTVTSYYIPYTAVSDIAKLKAQIKLPSTEREFDEETSVYWLEKLIEFAAHEVSSDGGFEPQGAEHIVFSANVLMY